MPYVTEVQREVLKTGLVSPKNCGELNYCFTMLIVRYLAENGLKYQTCNDIVGALENAKDEFQRRVQHPYEDRKISENGDVY